MISLNSHLEYFKVDLTRQDDDIFFIEIRRSNQIVDMFKKINIVVFDSWHDDEIYSVDCDTDYIWIHVKSKFGIGSITFLPVNCDEKHKDYVIIHKYVYDNHFKPVIGVFVHPNTEERSSKTKEHIISLKNSGLPIYLCSNIGCSDDLVSLCDGYIYTGPNELHTVPEDIKNKRNYLTKSIKNPVIIYPEETPFYSLHSFINGRGTYLYSAANCLNQSMIYLNKLGFTHIMISEGEFILDESDSDIPNNILHDMYKNNIVLDFFYTQNSNYLQAYLWFGNINHICNSFKDISVYEKHYPRTEENSDANAFILCEKYYMNKLVSYDSTKKIKIRTSEKNFNLIKKKYWYTDRTNLLLYEEKTFGDYKEQLSFHTYFPNTKKIFLSIASENIKSDNLTNSSFDLDIYNVNDQNWIFIFKNNLKSKKIKCKYVFYCEENIIFESETPYVAPDLFFFNDCTNINVNITKCDYHIYLEDNFDYCYTNTIILN